MPQAIADRTENLQKLQARIQELERTEADLRCTVAELRAVFKTFPDLHFRLAADGTILSFYAGNAVDLYVSPDAFLGRRIDMVLPAEVAAQVHSAISEVLATESLVCREYQLPVRTGVERFEARFIRFTETQVIAIVRNVTSQKRAEEALRDSEARFSSAFEHAPVGMALVGLDGKSLRVNRALCQIFGYSEPELLAMPVWQITHPDDMMVTVDWLRRMIEGQVDTWRLEKRFVHRLGHTVWGLSDTSVVRGSDGQVLYVISQVQDITEYKRTQEQLSWLASFPEDDPNPVIETDGTGRLTYLNCAARAHFPETVAEDLLPGLLAGLETVQADDARTPIVREIRCGPRVYEEHIVRGRDRMRFFLRDMTERMAAEGEVRVGRERLRALSHRLLEVQETERRHLARELHDEIGQVLTALTLTVDALDGVLVPAGRTRLTEARQLLNDLIARVRDLSLDLRPSMLDDLGLLPALLWFVERYARQTNVRVCVDHSGVDRRFAPEIETAAYRIVQEALTNVARHAGVTETRVRLRVEDRTLRLEVADDGKGFDAGMATVNRTTGGLSGMRERAQLLDGELTVESTLGKGTRVSAELPIGA